MNNLLDYDVVIVGAGTTGLTLAALLTQIPALRIAVIAPSLPSLTLQPTLDCNSLMQQRRLTGWVSALTPASRRMLENIGIWQQLPPHAVGIFQKIKIWDHQAAQLEWGRDTRSDALGYVVPNRLLQATVFASIVHHPAIHYLSPNQLVDLSIESDRAILRLADHSTISTALVVGADGAQSTVRSLSKIQCHSGDYEQTALVAAVQHTKPHISTARQVFLKSGPLAFLPLADPYYSTIVWTTSPLQAAELASLADADFCKRLSQTGEDRLGEIQAVCGRRSFRLYHHHCAQYVKPHVALVGDAAHRVHPLAGQGANLGLADSAYLAKMLTITQRQQRPIGAIYHLKPYERKQKLRNSMIICSIHTLRSLFAQQHQSLSLLRAFGLARLQQCAWFKHQLSGLFL